MPLITAVPPRSPATDDGALLARLRDGDEAAFVALVDRYGPVMLRLALGHVRTQAVAEEVVQEAWVGVLAGLDRFEGRSSLKTWILRILINRAKSRGVREARSVPFSALTGPDDPPVEPLRRAAAPASWAALPEERLAARETVAVIRDAVAALPARQREVVVLRDVEGWEPEEVCAVLGLSEGNQRVLLHRGRSRVRAALERHLEPEAVA